MVSFTEVKQITTIDRVASWLGLKSRNNRMDCPHSSTPRAIAINPTYQNKDGSLGNFRCFACNAHGDLIQLAAHINKVPVKQAAVEIMSHFHGVPETRKKGLPTGGFTDLEYAHERIQALGITPDRAQEYGIGYRNKGTTRKALLIPVRQGPILGYIIQDEDGTLRLYKSLQDKPSE